MPAHLGFSHVSLSVRDLAASERWYQDVLGFEPFERPPGHGWDEVVMFHRDSGAILCLQAHDANDGQAFRPGAQPSQPGAQASQPGAQANRPGAQASQSGAQAGVPWTGGRAPGPGP